MGQLAGLKRRKMALEMLAERINEDITLSEDPQQQQQQNDEFEPVAKKARLDAYEKQRTKIQ